MTIKIKLTIQDMLRNIHKQSMRRRRIPYPVQSIIEKAGINFDELPSVNPSAIKCSPQYFFFAFRFDGMEKERLQGNWMGGAWLVNIGPNINESLEGLEFEVDTTLLRNRKE